ncbi:unnamed protein product [Schistocephalus solidus]|uniref:Lipoprotein n=1 Tax=Schistocephalus solidus TaxID=70667 RepID=A0A183T3Z4_SCHSO|nr:unnamed protein product [Schistocephalus solidus]
MYLFAAGCANFGLTIITAKTVVMPQPPPSAEYNAPRINVNAVVMPQPPPSAEYNAPRINVNGAQRKMWKPLLIWKARCHESMTRLLNGSPKPVRSSANYRPPRGIATVSLVFVVDVQLTINKW